MKLIFFLIITSITASLFGQENQIDSSIADFKKVQIGLNFSPDFCFRTLKNDDSSISPFITNSRNTRERGKLSFTTGLNVIFNFKKNIGIETGIQYSNKGYQTKLTDFTYTKAKLIYNYYYLDIPLKVNFAFGKKKIRLITSAGLTTNVFIKSTSEYDDVRSDKNRKSTLYDYKRWINLSSLVSFGIDWKLNSKNNLRVEPTFRYSIFKIVEAPVGEYLWNAGINISYFFGLK